MKIPTAQEMEEVRPPEFPPDLWQYVCDQQKPLIKERFTKYPDDNCSTKASDGPASMHVSTTSQVRSTDGTVPKSSDGPASMHVSTPNVHSSDGNVSVDSHLHPVRHVNRRVHCHGDHSCRAVRHYRLPSCPCP